MFLLKLRLSEGYSPAKEHGEILIIFHLLNVGLNSCRELKLRGLLSH